jgi:hypothetical protein
MQAALPSPAGIPGPRSPDETAPIGVLQLPIQPIRRETDRRGSKPGVLLLLGRALTLPNGVDSEESLTDEAARARA